MAVAVEAAQTFKCGKPEPLFRETYTSLSLQDGYTWDISPDGKRFLMMKEPGTTTSAEGTPRKIDIVLNWFEELKQRVPVKQQCCFAYPVVAPVLMLKTAPSHKTSDGIGSAMIPKMRSETSCQNGSSLRGKTVPELRICALISATAGL